MHFKFEATDAPVDVEQIHDDADEILAHADEILVPADVTLVRDDVTVHAKANGGVLPAGPT